MSLAWHAIRDNLLHCSRTLTFQRRFDLIRRNCSVLAAFRDPAALLDTLHRQSGSPDGKNECLRALVRQAQRAAPESDTALTVLLLALWPGLDSVRRHLLRRRIAAPADITSGILARATESLRGLDLGRVNRVAATVLQNVQRDMIRACCQEAELRRVTSSAVPEDLPDPLAAGRDHMGASLLHADLVKIIGDDAFLVIRVAVEGFTQAEVAVELGLSEEATRKRYQRAAPKLRKAFKENV